MKKIKLSDIQDPQDAIAALISAIRKSHELEKRDTRPHYAFFGKSTELMWQMLLAYREGAKVTWIHNQKNKSVQSPFQLPSGAIESILSGSG